MKIIIVGGTRPNFIKIAPLCREFEKRKIDYILVHTGQHYDKNMSDIFFTEFNLKKPNWNLNVSHASQTIQTARIMEEFENVCNVETPDLVIVVGDVTSTIACALVVSKFSGIKLAHVEAGGRSFDKNMPEEINRIVTDVVSDYLFAIAPSHVNNLLNEGIDKNKIFLVGDTIIDNLLYTISILPKEIITEKYILTTVHRQSNTDNISNLQIILESLNLISKKIKVKFPIHPRTKKIISNNKLEYLLENVEVLPPLGYSEFIKELRYASVIITDSGGVTIEAAVLKIPCVVIRDTIERKFLVEEGATILSDINVSDIIYKVDSFIDKKIVLSDKWNNLIDGKSSNRIVNILIGER